MWPIFDCYWNMPLFVYRIRDVILIIKDVAFSRKSALLLKLRTLIEMYANSFRFTQWNHLFYFLLQGIILILKCSRYFICSESIKKMSIFAWYFVFFIFSRDQCRFAQAPFKKLNILPLVIYMVHHYSFFRSTADFVIKKEHLGFLPDLAISKRQRRRVKIWP